MGVVSYILVPVVRDLLSVAGFTLIAASLDQTLPRLSVSLLSLWLAWLLNLLGIRDEALIVALKTGRIAAAGLEVYESEPTFTPHIARCQTRFCYRIWERPRLRHKTEKNDIVRARFIVVLSAKTPIEGCGSLQCRPTLWLQFCDNVKSVRWRKVREKPHQTQVRFFCTRYTVPP
jgi:hypothetical protein